MKNCHYYEKFSHSIVQFSLRKWYDVLLEDRVLMTPDEQNSSKILTPVRPEVNYPHNDWPRTWQRLCSKGLYSELRSFLFRLVHGILPTQTRIARFGLTEVQGLDVCSYCHIESEDICHALFRCPRNAVAGLQIIGWLQNLMPNIAQEDIIVLKFDTSLTGDEELACIYILAIGL